MGTEQRNQDLNKTERRSKKCLKVRVITKNMKREFWVRKREGESGTKLEKIYKLEREREREGKCV